ncbi:MAG: restriction endonuclease subunit S [Desulfobacterales bacterium]|nr:restriction endonuclease subunit S [Desulfobacterales bacterium]
MRAGCIQNPIKSNSQNEESFPEGWTIARLEQICTAPQYGWTTSANKNGTGLRLLRTTDISKGVVDWSTVPYCKKKPDNPEKYLLSPGDLVVSRAGSVGLSYVVRECPRSIFASYLIRFRAVPSMESEFIGLFLKTPQYWAAIADETAGIAIPNVNASKLKRLEIPLPPLAEQKRIVAKVEQLLARVNAARERLAKVPEILKRFRQSVLAAACSGKITADWRKRNPYVEPADVLLKRIGGHRKKLYERECVTARIEGSPKPRKPINLEPKIRYAGNGIRIPDTWFWTSFKDVASVKKYSMSSGPFGSVLGRKDYQDKGIPVVRGQNIQNGKFTSKNFVYISAGKARNLERSTAYPGDIVVVAVGSSGQAAIIPDSLTLSVLSQNCNKITVDRNLAIPEFVNMFLQIEIARAQLRERTTDTARPFLSLRAHSKIISHF